MPRRARTTVKSKSGIVVLAHERERRQLRAYRDRAEALLDANKKALAKLFTTGTLFTKQGARAGRELLATYTHLLKVSEVLGKLAALEAETGSVRSREARRLLAELDSLIRKSKLLSTHADDLLTWFGQ